MRDCLSACLSAFAQPVLLFLRMLVLTPRPPLPAPVCAHAPLRVLLGLAPLGGTTSLLCILASPPSSCANLDPRPCQAFVCLIHSLLPRRRCRTACHAGTRGAGLPHISRRSYSGGKNALRNCRGSEATPAGSEPWGHAPRLAYGASAPSWNFQHLPRTASSMCASAWEEPASFGTLAAPTARPVTIASLGVAMRTCPCNVEASNGVTMWTVARQRPHKVRKSLGSADFWR